MQRRPFCAPALGLALVAAWMTACSSKNSTEEITADRPTSSRATQSKPTRSSLHGSFSGINSREISGWAYDSAQPDKPIRVDVYDGAELLATVLVNDYRPGLVKSTKSNGRHGFEFLFPNHLRDGKEHTFAVKFAGTNTPLNHSPKTLKLEPLAKPASPPAGQPKAAPGKDKSGKEPSPPSSPTSSDKTKNK